VETVESQPQAFHRSHERLEIATAAISTFPRRRLRSLSSQTKTKPKDKILWDRGKVEIQNPDFHFPTVPVCLRRKEERRGGGSSSHQQE
jgi:hypothetical protein